MAENNKEKKKTKSKNIFKRIKIRYIIIGVLVIALAVGGVLGYNIYKDTEAYDPERLLSSGATQYFDNEGNLIYTYGNEKVGKRSNITYEELPQVLIDAVVAAEDSRFFEHQGFDLPRIAKALITNTLHIGNRSGGSTITQQLIKKSYFPNEEKTYTRKISEVILATKADQDLSKEEILALYLNKIYFGRSMNSIGISAACKYYFNKDVSQLTLPEAAMLAGALNSPSSFDPYYNLNKATQRRNVILNLMVKHGYITQEECDLAKQTKIENTLHASTDVNNSVNAAYIDMVTKEIKEKTGIDPASTQLKVYTYCNQKAQKVCTDLGNGLTYSYSDPDMRMGASVQSSQDGRIIACIGGRDYTFGNLNFASQKQQPGSAVKPFLDYGLAFEKLDWSTGHSIVDEPYSIGSFSPKNWDRNFHGSVTVSDALEQSWNIPAVKTYEEVEKKIGSQGITSAMKSLGISMDSEEPNIAYAIGGWKRGISPVEMASAYATISNNGKYVESHTINCIEVVQTGEVINIDEKIQKDAAQSYYSAESAFMVREVMLGYTKNHSGNYAYLSSISNVGAKTGTSNWDSSASNGKGGKSRDLWMNGFTANYICSVWMGFAKEGIDKGKTTSDYKAYPGKVCGEILKYCQTLDNSKSFPSQPSGVEKATIVKGIYPYVLPAEGMSGDSVIEAWFKKGTVPTKAIDSTAFNLMTLSSFEASLDSSNKINVVFGPYNPETAISDDNATDGTKLFGKVRYSVSVSDEAGNILATEHFTTPTASLAYVPSGNVKVIGYYSYEKDPNRTSNKVEKTLGQQLTSLNASVTCNGAEVQNGSTISSSTALSVIIHASNDKNTFHISLLNSSGSEVASSSSSSVTISNIAVGSYTLKMTESNGTQSVEKAIKFTVN